VTISVSVLSFLSLMQRVSKRALETTVLKAAGRKSLLSHKDYPPISNPLRGGKCSPQATPGYPTS